MTTNTKDTSTTMPDEPDFSGDVRRVVEEQDGFWKSCSGCHETVDGQETGRFPYSRIFQCHLGFGCRECGGIGAVWDNTDYEDMARFMEQERADKAPQGQPQVTKTAEPVNSGGVSNVGESCEAQPQGVQDFALDQAIQLVKERFIVREDTKRQLSEKYFIEADRALAFVIKAARSTPPARPNISAQVKYLLENYKSVVAGLREEALGDESFGNFHGEYARPYDSIIKQITDCLGALDAQQADPVPRKIEGLDDRAERLHGLLETILSEYSGYLPDIDGPAVRAGYANIEGINVSDVKTRELHIRDYRAKADKILAACAYAAMPEDGEQILREKLGHIHNFARHTLAEKIETAISEFMREASCVKAIQDAGQTDEAKITQQTGESA